MIRYIRAAEDTLQAAVDAFIEDVKSSAMDQFPEVVDVTGHMEGNDLNIDISFNDGFESTLQLSIYKMDAEKFNASSKYYKDSVLSNIKWFIVNDVHKAERAEDVELAEPEESFEGDVDIDEEKLMNLQMKIVAGKIHNQRMEEIDTSMFDSWEDVDLPTVLYVVFGLEEGEDYQISNDAIMIADEGNLVWDQVRRKLG